MIEYCCNGESYYDYYSRQAGAGFFSGGRQKGFGLGNLFKSFGRMVTPLISRGARTLGKQLLTTGAHVARDVLSGESVGSSIKNRARQAGVEVLDEITGSKGIKRKRAPAKKGKSKRRRRDIFDG